MKNSDKRVTVKFAGIGNYADVENAPAGMCEKLVNMREKRDAVSAVGRCLRVGTLATGEKIVAVHCVVGASNMISAIGGTLYWHSIIAVDGTVTPKGVAIASVDADIISVVAVGDFLVCATQGTGMVVKYDFVAGCYTWQDISGAVPRLLLSPSGKYGINDTVAAQEFDAPLTRWQHPLPTGDVERISANVGDAYKRLAGRAAIEGYMIQPVLARYAVRLWNDSYLWVSAPLLIGNGIQSLSGKTTATSDGSTFTGINAAPVEVETYRLSVVVETGTDVACDRLIKSIDILMTDEIDPVDYSSLVDYSCTRSTSGGSVVYDFAFELPVTEGGTLLARLLEAKRWHVVASISDFDALRQGRVNAANCIPSANATDLPAGVHRYEIAGNGADVVEAADIDRCITASSRHYCHTALCCHNRRLFAACDRAILVNSWHPSQFWHGKIVSGSCRILVEADIMTDSGIVTTIWQGMSEFVPEELTPVVSYPDARAVSMVVSILPTGGTLKRVTVQLHGVLGCDTACSAAGELKPLQFEDTGSDMLPVPSTTVVADGTTGQLLEYEDGNPLAVAAVHNVCGCVIRAIAAADHHSNDNIGTPLYIFADDGTYAMPYRVATSCYSPAVIVSRRAAAPGVPPVVADAAVYFATSRGDVCRINRYTVETVLQGVAPTRMAWNCNECELWLLSDVGVTVLMQSGRTYMRNDADYKYLFGLSSTVAYAATAEGQLLDILCEDKATPVGVELLTCPMVIADVAAVPVSVSWKIFADDASLSLAVNGENGASCHGAMLCRLKASGRIAAPLTARLVSPPVRTVRLSVSGTVKPGTIARNAGLIIKTLERF